REGGERKMQRPLRGRPSWKGGPGHRGAAEGYTCFCYGRHVARPRGSKGGFEPSTLFAAAARREAVSTGAVPLAERMRPARVEDFVGQRHLVGPGKLLANAIEKDRVPSMILWGPPGVGKTTLGKVIASRTKSVFVPFSAVLGSIAE